MPEATTGWLKPIPKPPGLYRFLDVFAGIGGFRFGFEPNRGRCVWSCEIDPHARRTYTANHGGREEDIFRDVRQAQREDVPDHEVLIAGFACFAQDTMVLSDMGYIPIQEVAPGTLVLTHTGSWKPVTSVMRREDIPTRQIRAQGVPGIITTDEHPFLTRRRENKRKSGERTVVRTLGETGWTRAEDIDGDNFLSQRLPPTRPDGFTPEFWWMVGRYLADGFTNKRHHTGSGNPVTSEQGNVVITCARQETGELKQRIRAAGYHATISHQRTADNHIISSKQLYQWIGQFGQYAHGKRLSRIALELEQPKAKALLDGYLSGDGCRTRTKNDTSSQWTVSSVSKALALGVALLAQRAYGVVATIQKYEPREKTHVIEGRTVNQRVRWTLRIPERNRSGTIEENLGWKKVRRNAPTGDRETVWNISVADDESYIADGAIVHNCQTFSLQGVSKLNALGRPHGFQDTTRGTLFFEICRILAEHRPQAFLLENVPNLVHHDGGRTFQAVLEILGGELRYHVSHRILDARPYVPQSRRRVFIAGHREADRPRLEDLELPPPGTGPSLADILHPQDGSELPEEPFTTGPMAAVAPRYTLGDGTWMALLRHRSKHHQAGNGFGYTLADPQEATRTLTARYHKDGQEILIRQEGANPRRLTPRECARLMGMPQLRIPVSDTRAYWQLGNSVVPPLVERIAAHLMG